MDQRIMKGLEALGLSEERIAEFAAIVDGVKERVKAEGLITRKKRTPPAVPKLATPSKPPKRRIVVSYKPRSNRTVADELAMLEGRLERQLPPWQRPQIEARIDALRRTGEPMPETAKTTLAHLPGAVK